MEVWVWSRCVWADGRGFFLDDGDGDGTRDPPRLRPSIVFSFFSHRIPKLEHAYVGHGLGVDPIRFDSILFRVRVDDDPTSGSTASCHVSYVRHISLFLARGIGFFFSLDVWLGC